MIIYNVTVHIDEGAHRAWKEWMLAVHLPDVMATELFLEARFSRILTEVEEGYTYSIQYLCNDIKTLKKYQQDHAARLQADHEQQFAGQYVAFRTVLRVDKVFHS